MVSTETVDTTPKSTDPGGDKPGLPTAVQTTEKQELPKLTPVAVELMDTVPESTPQPSGTISAAKVGHSQLQKPEFTPITPDLSDPIKIAPQERKWEQTLQELAGKGLAPATKEFSYVGTIPMTRAEKIRLGENFGSKPVSTGYHGDWYEVQPEETKGGFGPRTYEIPSTYEGVLVEYGKAKGEYEAIGQKLEEYAREHNYQDCTNNPGYGALSAEYNRAWRWLEDMERQVDLWNKANDYASKSYEDNFFGQWGANYNVGKLTEEINAAYYAYLEDPTEANLAYAKRLEEIQRQFLEENAVALDSEGEVLSLLSRDLAGYLPQWLNQQKAGVSNGVPAAIAAMLPVSFTTIGMVPAAKMGFSAGYSAGVGEYSYEQMSGAAYRELIAMGVDEEIARIAARDEGVVSGFIEAADALGDILTFGTGMLFKKMGGSAVAKIAEALAKYGINVYAEGKQEGAQKAVSLANRERILNGEYDENAGWWERKFDLAGEAVETLQDAYSGEDEEAHAEIKDAEKGGRRLALILAGFGTASNITVDTYANNNGQTNGIHSNTAQYEPENRRGSTVQSPVERGIMLAEKQYSEIVEQSEKTALLEQSFLSGLMDDTENSTVSPESRTQTTADPSSMTAQERLAMLGETILDRGGMPSQEQLSAMGIDEPTARGIQSLVWLSKEGSPTQQRAVEAMVDLTAPQMQLEQRQEADFTRVPVGADVHALNAFDSSNSSENFGMSSSDSVEDGSYATDEYSGGGKEHPKNKERRKTFDLQPTHSRTLSKREMSFLEDDVRTNGIREKIKCVEYDGHLYVVDGHHRLLIAKRLRLPEVPVEIVELPYAGYSTVDDLLWFE